MIMECAHRRLTKLAQDVVRTAGRKFITLHVNGAPDDVAARKIASTIGVAAVKTAFMAVTGVGAHVAAAGRAGIDVDPMQMQLWFAPDESPVFSCRPSTMKQRQVTCQGASVVVTLECGLGGPRPSGRATSATTMFH